MKKQTKIITTSLILLVVLGNILFYVKTRNNLSKPEKIRIVTSTFLKN